MKVAVVVEGLNIINIPFLIILRVFFVKIIYFEKSDLLKNKFFLKIITLTDLIAIDFTKPLRDFCPSVIDGDINDFTRLNAEKIMGNLKNLDGFKGFFDNIKNLQEKILVFSNAHYSGCFKEHMSMAYWLSCSKYKDYNFFVLVKRPNNLRFFKQFDLKVYNISLFNSYFLFKSLALFKNFMIAKIKSNIFKKKYPKKPINENAKDYTKNTVMYFPHNSIFSGLLRSDHVYSSDINSTFHPSNIYHLEFDSRANIADNKRNAEQYLNVSNLYYDSIKADINLKDLLLSFMAYFYKNLFYPSRLKLIFLFISLHSRYSQCLRLLEKYKNVKIAVYAYAELTPIHLSLALESRNIRTIGLQDRYRFAFINQYYYLIDSLLVSSKKASDSVKKLFDDKIAPKTFITGMIRTDNFFIEDRDFKLDHPFKINVLCLDYQYDLGDHAVITHTLLNYKNIIFIKKELIKLAKKFPEINFIVRGKNKHWIKSHLFKDVLNEINNMNNITVDLDFDDIFRTYKLSKKVDMILSVPSSIAEECIANALHTIVFDYGINYRECDYSIYEHSKHGCYCRSFDEVCSKVSKLNDSASKKIINQDQLDRDFLFGKVDGKVKERVHKVLNQIHVET